MGWTKEDDPAAVAANRSAFAGTVARGAAMQMVTVGQVHGSVVRDLDEEPPPWMTEQGKARMEGDGLLSRTPGRLLAILTADCVPVLLADTRTHAVGAFHAGWRGTLARIVEQGVSLMRSRYGSRPEELIAAIGPCIGACCFEVGAEVGEAFGREFAYGRELSRPSSADAAKLYLDLVEANRRQLVEAGVAAASVQVLAECTACTRGEDGRRRFYSYRAEGGVCGRMLSAIGAVA